MNKISSWFLCVVILVSLSYYTVKSSTSNNKVQRVLGTAQEFIHPGIVNSAKSLDLIRTELNGNSTTRIKAFQQVLDFIDANPISKSYPSVVLAKAAGSTDTEAQIRRDAILAYALALKWAATGKEEDAANAISVLNGWARNFTRYAVVKGSSSTQSQLEGAWVTPNFVAAAEIIRYYKINNKGAGWNAADVAKFNDFLINLNQNNVSKMVSAMGRNYKTRRNNWGISAGYAKIALGVYFDDRATYEVGKGILLNLLPTLIQPDGQIFEFCERDCVHPQYTMCGLTLAAEIARIQGDRSIYESSSERIRTGWEWMNKAYNDGSECRDCSKSSIFSAIEVANNYYKSPQIEKLITAKAPFNPTKGHTFLEFLTYTHRKVSRN